MDYGHKVAEKELNELEKRLAKEYKQASFEIEQKANAYFEKFAKRDKEMKEKLDKDEYKKWRENQMLRGQQYKDMQESLAKDYTNANKIASNMINQNNVNVYATNMNYGTYEVEHGSGINTSFSLYDKSTVERLVKDNPQLLPKAKVDVPKDMRWNMGKINSALTQGILQGESVDKIAKRLQSVTDMNRNSAVRNARTMCTGSENAGRMDSYERAKDMGIQMKKQWIATLDERTRDSHAELDGKIVDTDEEFDNGLMYPADPDGEPAEVYNCRCTMIAVVGDYDYHLEDRHSESLEHMSYEEWHNRHESGKSDEDVSASEVRLKTIQDIERKDRSLDYEKGAVISNDGEILARYDGTTHAVEVTDADLKLMENATFTHNHPSGGFFSNNDIITGFTKTNLQELRASTPQGITYSLVNNGATKESALKYLAEYQQTSMRAQRTAQEHFIRQIKAGELSMEEYQKNYFALFSQYRDEKLIKMTKEKASDFGFIFEVIKDEK